MKSFLVILPLLLLTSFLINDEGFLELLTKKFEAYQKENPVVKVHLFFNQDKYSPGDTAFYQLHFLTEELQPVAGRQIVNLDVVNAGGRVVQQQVVRVNNGSGSNQIVFSKNLTPGIYTLIAYNDWMKNFDPGFFFQKAIVITGQKVITPDGQGPPTVTFHPEGGKLIQGISNKVVVSAPPGTLQIMDDHGNEVAHCRLNEKGLGFFVFAPEASKTYQANVNGSTWSLPPVEPDGIALLIQPHSNQVPLRILLAAPENSRLREPELYLVVVAQGTIYNKASFKLEAKEFIQVTVPQNDLPAGVAGLFVLNGNGQVLAERLFFVDARTKAHTAIAFDKSVYHPREKVTLEILLTDESGSPLQGNFAITAVNKKLFQETSATTIQQELWITSNFASDGSENRAFLDDTKEDWLSSLDNYLITKKWNRFDWRKILDGASAPKKFEFRNTLKIEGTAIDKTTGQPVPDSTLMMVYLQDHMMGYETHTTKDGAFELPFLFDFWETDRLFYLMEQKRKELPKAVMLLRSDSMVYRKGVAIRETDQIDPYGDYKFKKSLMDRSFSFYAKSNTANKKDLSNANADFEDEVTGVDVSVNVDDYIVFPTMEDLIREVIPSLQFRKIGGKPAVRVLLSEANINPYQGDPLYVIDGVMTKNSEYFLNLKPADIVTVKIVKDVSKLSRFGAMGKNGMVLIQTKKTDPQLALQGSILPVQGLSKPVPFPSPDHAQKLNPRVPDFRSTFYWNPLVKTDRNGKATISFFASDDVGPIKIRVEGITADGRPFSKEDEIAVVFDPGRN